MTEGRIILHELAFTGPGRKTAKLSFERRPNFVYGASNTGKSFSLSAIDFLLGAGSGTLHDIDEAAGYDKAWLTLTLPSSRTITLSRARAGGDFNVWDGLRAEVNSRAPTLVLGGTHRARNPDTLSNFLLSELGLAGRRIAKNKSGNTENFTFRDLAPFVLLDETSIQAPRSPVTSGQRDDPREQSAFRLLISGKDDSAVVAKMTPPAFRTSKAGKIAAVDELILTVEAQISLATVALAEEEQPKALQAHLEEARRIWEAADGSLRAHLDSKRGLSRELVTLHERQDDIVAHLARFARLEEVYVSDIDRLEALEEAGFLLTLGKGRDCPLCGASAASQTKLHGIEAIEDVKASTLAEIKKIRRLRADLVLTVADLQRELQEIGLGIATTQTHIGAVEAEISKLLPTAKKHEATLNDLIARRDAINRLTQLNEQRAVMLAKRAEYKSMKQSRQDQPKLSAPEKSIYDFSKTVGSILEAWKFPGGHDVTFDDQTYDIKINGKLRTTNGKGVRALTHAAFKIGLLLYCRRNNLPHPGFVALDTPLLAYRDPVKSKKGALSEDEKTVAVSPVRENFFKHLSSLQNEAQFIILDNIDPPVDIKFWAATELFTGNRDEEGRFGFFPPLSR